MLRESFKNQGTFGKILLYLFVFFLMAIIGMAVTQLFFNPLSGDINTQKLNQFVLSIFLILLTPIIAGYLWYEKPLKAYKMDKLPPLKAAVLVILLVLAVSPFINLLSYLNEQLKLPAFMSSIEQKMMEMEDNAAELTKQMLNVHTASGLLLNLFVMAVTPAVCEELFFRGGLLNIFSEKGRNKHVAVWVVAAIFSLIHLQMYGFISRMVLGALFGYLMIWSQSIWLPILAHFTNNAMAVLVSYFGKKNGDVGALEEIGRNGTIVVGVMSMFISAAFIWLIYNTLNKERQTN